MRAAARVLNLEQWDYLKLCLSVPVYVSLLTTSLHSSSCVCGWESVCERERQSVRERVSILTVSSGAAQVPAQTLMGTGFDGRRAFHQPSCSLNAAKKKKEDMSNSSFLRTRLIKLLHHFKNVAQHHKIKTRFGLSYISLCRTKCWGWRLCWRFFFPVGQITATVLLCFILNGFWSPNTNNHAWIQ